MNVKALAQRLCLLLSWQEALACTPHAEPFAGQRYRKQATREVAAVRDQARAAIVADGQQLQAVIATDPTSPELDRLRNNIQQLNYLLKAQQASDLGGPVALSLDSYANAFPSSPKQIQGFQKLERQDFITIVVAVVIVLIVSLGMSWFYLWREDVVFSVEAAGPDHLALQLQNDGQVAVAFLSNWPEVLSPAELTTFGVTLYCRARDSGELQQCAEIPDIWTYQNEGVSSRRVIQVEPGSAITVVLDIRALESAYGAPLAEIQLACGSQGDRRNVLFTQGVLAEESGATP